MLACPGCGARQVRNRVGASIVWICERCRGRLASIDSLRKQRPSDAVERYWWVARRRVRPIASERACPVCNLPMKVLAVGPDLPTLDVCSGCQLFWFDPGEFELLPQEPAQANLASATQSPRRPAPPLPTSQTALDPPSRAERLTVHPAEPAWQFPFVFFGMPMEQTATRIVRPPRLTWSIAAVVLGLALAAFLDLDGAVARFGFVPAERWRLGGATVLTAFVLHADIFHLVGNLYYALVFGDNVEDFLGSWGFAALLLLATVGGDVAHTLLDPRSTVPCIGASGGISGLLAFYALRFRRARVLVFLGVLPIRASVWWAFLGWFGLQCIGLIAQARGISAVSAAAHFGGAAIGAAFYLGEEACHRMALRWRSSVPAT